MLKTLVICFFISMIPLIELRGAIPVGIGMMKLADGTLPLSNILSLYAVCLLGNMIPVPFIFLFARKFLEWGKDKKLIGGICSFFLEKGHRAGTKLEEKAGRGLYFALFLFVGIPLPGTGAWTGTLAASHLDMNWKKTSLAVICGVLLAGIIMLSISFGAASVIS
ncbi:MAG: small multi-drug export protein [Treponema sp.]|nr:small multi-drug export protein [Candidatus Treponema equifaecale]